MAEDVKVPGLGHVSKKTALIGGSAVLLIGGIAYWRYRKNAAAAQASATTGTGMTTDPAGNQCAQVAASGYCPGSPEDLSAQQSGYAYDSGTGGYGYGGGGVGYPGNGGGMYTDPNGNVCIQPDADGFCPQSVTGPPTGNQITTNAEWVQEVDNTFPNSTQALAMVLGGITVTTNQKNQFLEAVGVFGQPPQGYPTPIKTSDTPGHPGPQPKVTVPNVKGKTALEAQDAIRKAGLEPVTHGQKPPHGSAYVKAQNPSGGHRSNKGDKVTITIGAK